MDKKKAVQHLKGNLIESNKYYNEVFKITLNLIEQQTQSLP